MTEENEKLKRDMKTNEQAIAATGGKPLSSNACSMEALSSLTKKLQEISTTYDDVRRDITKLQQVQFICSILLNVISGNSLQSNITKLFSQHLISRIFTHRKKSNCSEKIMI
jgi:flagellar motor component MotA